MKIETHPRDDHQMTLVVELEQEKLEGARRKAARRIAEKVKIPGFRPGKAPFDVVRRLYGDGVITEEAVELLVDEIYPEAIKEAAIQPAAAGALENIESLEPPKFIFTIPLQPTVDLGNYQTVRLPYEWSEPAEAEVDEEIENLRRMYATTESVERPVQLGDYVMISLTGSKAGEEEGAAPLLERSSFAVVVRKEGRPGEWPFAGFSSRLLDAAPGAVIQFTHTFASDHEDESLKGQTVEIAVTIKTIRSVNTPELDDAFAQKTGLGQTVAELREKMRTNVNATAQDKFDDQYYETVMEQIKAGATIKYPPQVLEHEVEHVLEDMENRLKAQGLETLEKYFGMINTTREQFITEQARPTAQKRLERGLIMDEIARVEKIEIDQQSLEEEFGNTWAQLATSDEEFARRTKGGTKVSREIVDAVAMDSANRLLTRRVLERIKSIATSADGETPAAAQEAEAPAAKPAKKSRKKAE